MLLKKKKPPTTRRRFAHPWIELDYLCKKIRFWLYVRKDRHRAGRFVQRFESVLDQVPDNDMAIIRQEGLALFNELTDRKSVV